MADREKREGKLVLLVTVISRLLGLFRTQLLGFFFGAGGTMDIINYSYAVPNQARKSLEEGSGNIFLIPVLSKEKGRESALDFTLSIHLLMLILSLVFSLPLGWAIMHLSPYEGAERTLGMWMMPFFLVFLTLYSFSSSLMAFLQTNERKVLSSVLPLMQSAAVIFVILLFNKELGAFTYPVALLSGSLVFLLTSLLAVSRMGMRMRVRTHFDKRIVKSFIWSMAFVSSQVLLNFAYTLSSSFTDGGATYFANAYALILLPYGILLSLLSTVTYPELAKEKTEKGKEERFRKAIDWAVLLSVVTTFLMSTFSSEITITFFRTGLFTEHDAIMTARQIDFGVWAVAFMLISSYYQRIMILKGKSGILRWIILSQLVLAYSLVFILGSWNYAPSLIFTLTTMLGFLVYWLLDERSGQIALIKSVLRAVFSSLPMVLLWLVWKTSGFNMYSWIESKVLVVISSLGLGALSFILSLPMIRKLYK